MRMCLNGWNTSPTYSQYLDMISQLEKIDSTVREREREGGGRERVRERESIFNMF